VVLAECAVDGADDSQSGTSDHHLYAQAVQVTFIIRTLDRSDLVDVKGLTGDIDGVMMQVFDGPVKPLTIDGLEGHGVADGEGLYVHASPLEDEDVPLGPAKKWDEAYN
jgi:hypothetical protein